MGLGSAFGRIGAIITPYIAEVSVLDILDEEYVNSVRFLYQHPTILMKIMIIEVFQNLISVRVYVMISVF